MSEWPDDFETAEALWQLRLLHHRRDAENEAVQLVQEGMATALPWLRVQRGFWRREGIYSRSNRSGLMRTFVPATEASTRPCGPARS